MEKRLKIAQIVLLQALKGETNDLMKQEIENFQNAFLLSTIFEVIEVRKNTDSNMIKK